jgi:uncharacterized protein YbjT (DUF2867 family)
MIDPADVAAVAARVLLERAAHTARIYDLTGAGVELRRQWRPH